MLAPTWGLGYRFDSPPEVDGAGAVERSAEAVGTGVKNAEKADGAGVASVKSASVTSASVTSVSVTSVSVSSVFSEVAGGNDETDGKTSAITCNTRRAIARTQRFERCGKCIPWTRYSYHSVSRWGLQTRSLRGYAG